MPTLEQFGQVQICCDQYWVGATCRTCGRKLRQGTTICATDAKPAPRHGQRAKPQGMAVSGVSPAQRLGKYTGETFCESTYKKEVAGE